MITVLSLAPAAADPSSGLTDNLISGNPLIWLCRTARIEKNLNHFLYLTENKMGTCTPGAVLKKF
jgi:hypothetical protein